MAGTLINVQQRFKILITLFFLALICSSVYSETGTAIRRRRSVTNVIPQAVGCAVETCGSTEKTLNDNGKTVRFFDLPQKRNVRAKWIKAVPELSYMNSAAKLKVCELHFVGGAPSTGNPSPTLSLSKTDFLPTNKIEKESSPISAKKLKMDIVSTKKDSEDDIVVLGDTPSPQSTGEEEKPKKRNLMELLANNSNEPISLPRISANGAKVIRVRQIPQGSQAVTFGRTVDGKVMKIRKILKPSLVTGSLNPIPSTSQAATSISSRLPDGRVIPQSVNRAASTLAELSSKPEGSGVTSAPLTIFSALEKVRSLPVPSALSPASTTSTIPKGSCSKGDDKCIDEPCPKCVASLPMLRRTIGRLESQMSMMTNMVRTINQHIQSVQRSGSAQRMQKSPLVSGKKLLTGSMSAVSRSVSNTRPIGRPVGSYLTAAKEYKIPIAGDSGTGKVAYSIGNPSYPDKKTMARCVLLYPGNIFNVEELLDAYPNVSKKFQMNVFDDLLREMTQNGCIQRTDEDGDLAYSHKEATYAKETNIVKMVTQLETYGIPLAQYVKTVDA